MNRFFALVSAVILLAGAAAGVRAQTYVRKPFLQMGTPTSASVCWKLSAAASLTVRFGTDSTNLNRSTAPSANAATACVSLDTLLPGTRYHYAVYNGSTVVTGGGTPQYLVTSPTIGTRNRKYTFWLQGDFGVGAGHSENGTSGVAAGRVRDAFVSANGGPHTDGFLMLGDIGYENGTETQLDVAAFTHFPNIMSNTFTWPAMGNHEASTSQGAPYLAAFTLPSTGQAGGVASNTEYYYSWNYGNIHFIALEFEVNNRNTTSAQYLWLQQDLQSAAAQQADWIIAYAHHMPYTCCDHNSETESQLVGIRYNFLPLLEQYGVDMYFAGHSHDYERSFFLDSAYSSSATSTTQSTHYNWYAQNRSRILLDSSSGNPDSGATYRKARGGNNGAVYVVAGSGGKLENTTTHINSTKHPLMYVRHILHGSVILEIQDSVATARFVDTTRTVRDKFRIVKPVYTGTSIKNARRGPNPSLTPKFSQAGRRFHFTADNSLTLYVYAPDGSLLLQDVPKGAWDPGRNRLPTGEYYFRYGNDFQKVSLP